MNEKDNVNYLVESNPNNEEIFKNAMKKTKNLIESTQGEILFEDTDNKYLESSNKLFETLASSLDYFKKLGDLSVKNEDKVPTVKILKEDYENLKKNYELLLAENGKLKEKNKYLKENSNRPIPSSGIFKNNESLNVNKFIDSLMFLQTKNESLEKENKQLKTFVEKLKDKYRHVKKKNLDSLKNKTINTKSQSTLNTQGKNNKNDQMENLLKEQISCMKKMLCIVQDGKENTTLSSKKKITNEYLDMDSDSVSNIHFEESFNVTNMTDSIDYTPENEVM
jgi:cell division protein FtsB